MLWIIVSNVLLLIIVAGIRSGKLVESHGSFATASCTVCLSKHDPTLTKVL